MSPAARAQGAGQPASTFDDFAEDGVQIQARCAQAGHAVAQSFDLAPQFGGVAQLITLVVLRSKPPPGGLLEEPA